MNDNECVNEWKWNEICDCIEFEILDERSFEQLKRPNEERQTNEDGKDETNNRLC